MKEEVLQQVLSEVLTELKTLSEDQQLINVAIECYNKRISEYQESLAEIKINVPPFDLKELNLTIARSIYELKEVVKSQPKDVLHEKRILLYPEGDRTNFWKFILERSLLYSISAILIYAFAWLAVDSWKSNSENERYKCAYLWIYQQSSRNNKQYLFDKYTEFQNDSIFHSRRNTINPSFDK